jgi:MFS family permease
MAGASIGWPLTSALSGRLILRWGWRTPCIVGAVLLVLGFAMLWQMPADAGLWYPTVVQFVTGAGFGFSSLVFIIAAQNAVGWDQRGVVTSANQFARSIGGTIGVSVAGAIFSAGVASAAGAGVNPNDVLSPSVRATLQPAQLEVLQGALIGALHSVYVLFALVAALSVVIAALLPGGKPEQTAPPDERPSAPRAEAPVAA